MGLNCIDVSSYQGAIDWAKVKAAGIKYAILRSVVKGLDVDSQFEANMKNARAAGVQLGVYLYTYAGDAAYAKKEAQALLKLLAGRPLELGVFYDMEMSSLRSASAATVQTVANAFRAEIMAAGYTCGVYCDASFYGTNNHFKGWAPDCEFWVASYGTNDGQQHSVPKIDHHLIAHQYSSKGRVSGVSGDCDVDNWYGPAAAAAGVTEADLRAKVVKIAAGWIGCKEADGSHRQIIDVYNSHKPLARGYAVQYTDAWCSTFVSAVAIKAGVTAILPTECGCEKHTILFKNLGEWQENDAYTPKPADVIFYDWDDNGAGDTTGAADHVGIVETVKDGVITVIEGNYSDAVGRRKIAVNARYIRGYGLPNYAALATAAPAVPAAPEKKTVAQLAQEVIDGKWGNGADRKARLTAAGYDYDAVQDAVNKKLKPAGKTVEQLARKVIAGSWGNGDERKQRLTAAGYDYGAVQAAVNRMI